MLVIFDMHKYPQLRASLVAGFWMGCFSTMVQLGISFFQNMALVQAINLYAVVSFTIYFLFGSLFALVLLVPLYPVFKKCSKHISLSVFIIAGVLIPFILLTIINELIGARLFREPSIGFLWSLIFYCCIGAFGAFSGA